MPKWDQQLHRAMTHITEGRTQKEQEEKKSYLHLELPLLDNGKA